MLLRHLSIMVIAFSLAACGNSGDVAEAPATEIDGAEVATITEIAVEGPERRILAFGDSLFAGYGLEEQQGYPEQLEDAMRARGINARVIDAGVSGDTSAAGRQRLAFTLDAQAAKPDLVILELGGNDMLRGIQPDQTRANFEAMLEELRDREIPVLLMGMRSPPNYGEEYQRQFDALYGELAQEYDAALVPFWLESIYEDQSLFLDDRIHPTAEGITELVEDTVDDVEAALPPAG
ncbi:arylesterase [Erythrobacter sp. AP23]|uniref:arylesterase n=1 Tax=Erythrobacter sp. AP23 TaxID=499656 RepID=UPI00076DC896|nr:arylesterase [Erythrobacter sp. AP23]KWV94533.1 arylesterase [Erythrobacter sp. AP23]